MNVIKVAIAEDHPHTVKAIQTLLAGHKAIDIVFSAIHGKDLIDKLNTTQVDIILMDLSMPVMTGVEATRIIRNKYPEIKIIAHTFFDQEKNILEMSSLGVKSFVSKSNGQELITAIETVSRGGVWLPDEIAEVIQRNLKDEPNNSIELSGIEKFVLRAVVDGLTSKEIAKGLNKSHRTVDPIPRGPF